jgi:hypothetical protein
MDITGVNRDMLHSISLICLYSLFTFTTAQPGTASHLCLLSPLQQLVQVFSIAVLSLPF